MGSHQPRLPRRPRAIKASPGGGGAAFGVHPNGGVASLVPCIAELERYYAFASERWWENTLPPHVIVNLAARGQRQAPGWFGPYRWEVTGRAGARLHELMLAAEGGGRAPLEILQTLHVALVYLHCAERRIPAVHPRSGYHNLRFKREAEARGLRVERDGWRGWCRAAFTPEARALIQKEFRPDARKFSAFRVGDAPRARNKHRLWMCGCPIRARVAVPHFEALCKRCGQDFVLVEPGPRRGHLP